MTDAPDVSSLSLEDSESSASRPAVPRNVASDSDLVLPQLAPAPLEAPALVAEPQAIPAPVAPEPALASTSTLPTPSANANLPAADASARPSLPKAKAPSAPVAAKPSLSALRRGGANSIRANTPVPPSLQARVAAQMASRTPGATPPPRPTNTVPNGAGSSSTSSSSSSATPFQPAPSDLPSFASPEFGGVSPARAAPPVPAGSGFAGGGGIMARRKNAPGLSLGGLSTSPPSSSSSSSGSAFPPTSANPAGIMGRVGPNGLAMGVSPAQAMAARSQQQQQQQPQMGGAAGRRRPPGLSLAGMNGGQGAGGPASADTPFSNFGRIVCVVLSSEFARFRF